MISFHRTTGLSGCLAGAAITFVAPLAAYASCTLYEDADYGGAWYRLDPSERMVMINGDGCTTNGHGGCDAVTYYPEWNDDVSSFRITDDCTITLWEHINEGGAQFRTYESFTYVGGDWNDLASEALCTC